LIGKEVSRTRGQKCKTNKKNWALQSHLEKSAGLPAGFWMFF
jgi:hypothetical protein